MSRIQLSNYRIILITIGLIGVLLFASPTIVLLVKLPPGQEYSEIYLLGPDHDLSNLPFNIEPNVSYLLYLGVVNNLKSAGYYSCLTKFGNDSTLLPNQTLGSPSSLPSLYEYNVFLDDGATWETPFTFQIDTSNFANNTSQVSGININGIDYPVTLTSAWDSNKTGYYYSFFVELWLFNGTQGVSQYNDRFVSLILNMTQ